MVSTNGNFQDPRLHDIVLADQLPSDAWSEGIAVRPSGNIITTRIDEPELLAIDSASAAPLENEFDSVAPRLLHEFPNANGSFNLCRLPGTKREEYAVIAGQADLAAGQFSDWVIWRVVMPPEGSDEEIETSKIATVPGAVFLMGIVPISERILAVCDSHPGLVRRVDIETGESSVLFDDDAMHFSGVEGFFGINRVRFTKNYGWFTNTANGTFNRFPVEYVDGGKDVKPTGPAELIAEGLTNCDGLVMTRDARTAYICSYTQGYLWRVDMEGEGGAGKGTLNRVRSDLVSPTGMDLVYKDGREKPTLYVLCCGSISAESLEGERGGWLTMAKVDKSQMQITVTVTTEVTYEYI